MRLGFPSEKKRTRLRPCGLVYKLESGDLVDPINICFLQIRIVIVRIQIQRTDLLNSSNWIDARSRSNTKQTLLKLSLAFGHRFANTHLHL
jgi:hypothetical protein